MTIILIIFSIVSLGSSPECLLGAITTPATNRRGLHRGFYRLAVKRFCEIRLLGK